jgi:hypothetical protein
MNLLPINIFIALNYTSQIKIWIITYILISTKFIYLIIQIRIHK